MKRDRQTDVWQHRFMHPNSKVGVWYNLLSYRYLLTAAKGLTRGWWLKVRVWCCAATRGRSEHFLRPSSCGQSMDHPCSSTAMHRWTSTVSYVHNWTIIDNFRQINHIISRSDGCYCDINDKNCSLSIVLTAMDQKLQKLFLLQKIFLQFAVNTIDKLQLLSFLFAVLLLITVHFIALRLGMAIMHHNTFFLLK